MLTIENIAIVIFLTCGIAILVHALTRQTRVRRSKNPDTAPDQQTSVVPEGLPPPPVSRDPAHTEVSEEVKALGLEIEKNLGSCQTVRELFHLVGRSVRQATGLPAVALWTQPMKVDRDDTLGSCPPLSSDFDLLAVEPEEKRNFRTLFSPWSAALSESETVCIPDPGSEPDLCGRVRLHAGSLVLAPFPVCTSTMGVLGLAHPSPGAIKAQELVDARHLAGIISERAHALGQIEELHYRKRQAGVLFDVARALVHAPDMQATLRSILEAVHLRLGYENVALLLLDPQRKELYVASQVGFRESVDSLRLPVAGASITATVARERKTYNVPDVSSWPGYVSGSDWIHSELALPLIFEDELLGVLDVESDQPDAFDEAAGVLLEAVASEASLVLAHSRLLTGLETRASQLSAVDRMTKAIHESIDPETILRSVVKEMQLAIGCDHAMVVTLESEGRAGRVASIASRQSEPSWTKDPIVFETDVRIELSITDPNASYLPDSRLEDTAVAHWLETTEIRSSYQIPVIIEEQVTAVFLACSRQSFAFGDDQLANLAALAPHVSSAVRNANLYEELRISYEKLNRAQDELVRAEQFRVLGEMTSGLAHKFNNLLGAILGRVQMSRRRPRDPEITADLEVIEGAAKEGASTIRQLQQFTGVRADRQFARVDLSALVREVVQRNPKDWRPGSGEQDKNKQICLELAEHAWVMGHHRELQEVLEHAVDNALEAMSTGGTLEIRTKVGAENVLVEISDSGPGMSDEARARVFHPFFTTKGPRSLGLGLSIAYGIVQRHGGDLEVESSPDRGTTVRLTLPVSGELSNVVVDKLPSRDVTRSRAATILVVEDEPAVADLLGEILASAGHHPTMVNAAPDAVARLADKRFDVVLTDLGLPQMSGWELARHCRDLHPGLPVILVTGWGLEVEDRMITEAAIFEVIPKPFEVDQILNSVSRALEKASRESEAA